MNLKISVLSSGAVLLDGKPVDLAQLDEALRAGKETNATVLTLVAEAVRKRGWQLWAIDPRGIGELETPKSGRAFTVSLLRGENFVWRQGWDIRRILDLAATATPSHRVELYARGHNAALAAMYALQGAALE